MRPLQQQFLVFPRSAPFSSLDRRPRPKRPRNSPRLSLRAVHRQVLLDLVVRDKHERMVRDLTQNDIEVYEDGVKQDVRSFRLVSGAEVREQEDKAAAASPTPNAVPKLNPNREINLVLIVFRMIGDARQRQSLKRRRTSSSRPISGRIPISVCSASTTG